MKKLLSTILFGILFCAASANATPSLKQAKCTGGSPVTSISVSLAVVAGNSLHVFTGAFADIISVSDGTNTYSTDISQYAPSSSSYTKMNVYSARNIKGGFTTVTVTYAAPTYESICVIEDHGSGAFDVSSTNSQAETVTPATTGPATTSKKDIVYGWFVGNGAAQVWTAGSPFVIPTGGSVGVVGDSVEYDVQNSAGSIAATATFTGPLTGAGWAGILVSYVPTPLITQAFPVLTEGSTLQFTETDGDPGTWSLSGTNGSGGATSGAGTITSGGLYTAPSTVPIQQPYESCQLLANNDINNTRIDSFPLNINNNYWIGQADTNQILFYPSINHNVLNNTALSSYITSINNASGSGVYEYIPAPDGNIQSGWYNTTVADQHYFTVNNQTCNMGEMYFPNYPTWSTAGGAIQYLANSYTLPVPIGAGQSGSDVSGQRMQSLQLHQQEEVQAVASSGAIKHAMRFTAPNYEIHNQGGGGLGVSFLWPAANPQYSGGGAIPMGARARLKASFDISGYTPAEQIILTAWKRYGIILDDGGYYGWAIIADDDYWNNSPEIAALYGTGLTPQNFEFVDESGFMLDPQSGECSCNREIVTFTRTSDGLTISTDVILVGVTIGLPQKVLNFVAGSAPIQLSAVVNGSSNTGVTWTMSPSVGTLTSGGLYTAPSSETALTSTTVTATAAASPNPIATMAVNIIPFPSGNMYLFSSSQSSAATHGWPWPITVGGHTYQSLTTICTECSQLPTNGGSPPWASLNTAYIYGDQIQSSGSDIRIDLHVPNGTYQVTAKYGDSWWNTANTEQTTGDLNGNLIIQNLNVFTAAGGQYKPFDVTATTVVTNGELSYVVRLIYGYDNGISAITISNTSPNVPAAPPLQDLLIGQKAKDNDILGIKKLLDKQLP